MRKGRVGKVKGYPNEGYANAARPNVSVPEEGHISVICPIFGRGNCLTRTSERVASQGGLPGTPLLGSRVNREGSAPDGIENHPPTWPCGR
jgi:hypothetical protein